jgi:hypothetical protein
VDGLNRPRVFVLSCIAAGLVVAGYAALAPPRQVSHVGPGEAPVAGAPIAALPDPPFILFRDGSPGPLFGRIAVVSLTQPDDRRRIAPLSCERVLTAMFIPALELARDQERGGQNFLRLLGRAYADPAPFIRRFLSEQYAVMIARFKAAFGRALPQLPKKELSWRLHFVMGALSYTLAGTDALKLIAALSPREAGNDEMLLRRLAPFLVAGLKAPLPDLSEVNGGSVPGRQAGGR